MTNFDQIKIKEPLIAWNFDTKDFSVNAQIDIDQLCNAITVKNAGTTLVLIQGDILQPGESKAMGGNRMEILRGRFDIRFQTQVPPPLIITNLAFVTQKFYLPDDC